MPHRTERVLITLPKSLLADVQRYAQTVRAGNRSGFVADAIRAYIDQLHKIRHTKKLRESYAAAAGETRESVRTWDSISDETWAALDTLEGNSPIKK